jgi:FAD/FMN-containing dehydrogenase
MWDMNWTNWSGGQSCDAGLLEARSIDEVLAAIELASSHSQKLRTAGAGHSFSDLVCNDDTVLSLDALSGVEDVSIEGVAHVRAGTRLRDLGEPLREAGWALANQGDIDHQSIAGVVSTGTHGTGPTLQNFSAMVTRLRIATAGADLIECDAKSNVQLFEAARCGLGLFGVITDVWLQLVPTYRLHERVWRESPGECLSRLDERVADTRHFEFFWLPQKDQCELKSLALTESPPDEMAGVDYQYVDHSDRVFPSEREDRFEEMEFALPAEAGPECFAELHKWIGRRYPDLEWPIEYRTVAQDAVWLSPAHSRATVTISVHQAAELLFAQLFEDCQSIMRGFDGRPHWGKRHAMSAKSLAEHYPAWNQFSELRKRNDPQGIFLNESLEQLFGG